MIVKSETNPSGWFEKWIKGIMGGSSQKSEESSSSSESPPNQKHSSESSSSSSSDEDGGIKIPIPDAPSRLFSKKA